MTNMEFFEWRVHKAKKPHKCEMCNREIKIGTLYNKEVGKWCGEFFSRSLHPRCAHFEDAYCLYPDYNCEEGFIWEQVEESMIEDNCFQCPYFDWENDKCKEQNRDIYNCPNITWKYGPTVD